MKRQIFCFLMVCLFTRQTVWAAESWPNSAINTISTQTNGEGVRIAIIDTGISVNAIDKTKIAKGKNYITGDSNTEDKIGHGTAMAGILVGMESKRIIGIAPNATLVPFVYCTEDEDGKIINSGKEMLSKSIRDAVDKFDCQVILISAGAIEGSEDWKSAIEYTEKKGVVVVASVGNENEDHPEYLYYPASYETVIGVAALREDGEVATFSQQNSSVDLSAPGTGLNVCTIRGKTIKAFGTSYSAAFVTGGVAQLLSEYKSLTPEQVRKSLCNTAKDISAEGYDTKSGYGVLQIKEALVYAKQFNETNQKEDAEHQKNILITFSSIAIIISSVIIVLIILRKRTLKKGL
ncbi:MAG: S8 family serine peptidase [Oscillospiraceae bacterium]